MNLKLEKLQDLNLLLQENIDDLNGDKTLLKSNVGELSDENLILNEKAEGLSIAVDSLQRSEKEIKDHVEKLTEKIQAEDDQDLKNQLEILAQQQADTHNEIHVLMERLKTLETGLKQASTSGIFTYIEKEEDQSIFIEKVEEAIVQGMTYAQINKFLTKNLPSELDKIIKKHPALTKKFIRNLRKN